MTLDADEMLIYLDCSPFLSNDSSPSMLICAFVLAEPLTIADRRRDGDGDADGPVSMRRGSVPRPRHDTVLQALEVDHQVERTFLGALWSRLCLRDQRLRREALRREHRAGRMQRATQAALASQLASQVTPDDSARLASWLESGGVVLRADLMRSLANEFITRGAEAAAAAAASPRVPLLQWAQNEASRALDGFRVSLLNMLLSSPGLSIGLGQALRLADNIVSTVEEAYGSTLGRRKTNLLPIEPRAPEHGP